LSRPADTVSDLELIEAARDVIRRNYDVAGENHTVGAAIRCASGNIYLGVNVYSLHGSCAEFIAIGAAITAGEREFVSVACARGVDGQEILAPCGNCSQMLNDYAPGCEAIVPSENGAAISVGVRELLPYASRAGDSFPTFARPV
jgi:cytidine deaminase